MLGPYIKSRGTRATEMSSKCSPHHNGDICTTRGNNLKTSFSDTSQNVQINVYFGLFRGPLGGLQWSDWAYLAFQPPSHPYPCTCQIRKQSDQKFLSLNPKYEKNIYFFSYLGGPGGPLCQTQVNENFRAVRPYHRADICITRGKNNCQFFIYGPQYTKMCIFGYSGALGGP